MGFMWSLVQFLFLHSLISFTVTNCSSFIQPSSQCHEDESHALLQFKEGFVISNSASYNRLSYPKIASWNASTDCCSSWDGIMCDEHTHHVIAIDLSVAASSMVQWMLIAVSSALRTFGFLILLIMTSITLKSHPG